MDIEKFNFIKEKYGHCASWAIWREQGNHPPRFNMGDLSILRPPTKYQSPITIETKCGFCWIKYIKD